MLTKLFKQINTPNISFTATAVNMGKGTMTGKLTVTNTVKTITVPVNVTKMAILILFGVRPILKCLTTV